MMKRRLGSVPDLGPSEPELWPERDRGFVPRERERGFGRREIEGVWGCRRQREKSEMPKRLTWSSDRDVKASRDGD
jgi:hypothetical protein